jgi:hypothetical protein
MLLITNQFHCFCLQFFYVNAQNTTVSGNMGRSIKMCVCPFFSKCIVEAIVFIIGFKGFLTPINFRLALKLQGQSGDQKPRFVFLMYLVVIFKSLSMNIHFFQHFGLLVVVVYNIHFLNVKLKIRCWCWLFVTDRGMQGGSTQVTLSPAVTVICLCLSPLFMTLLGCLHCLLW